MIVRPVAAGPAPTSPAPSASVPQGGRPDAPPVRPEAVARVRALHLALLGGRSATSTLDAWCAEHRPAPGARLVAWLVAGPPKAATRDQRRRLQVSDDEPIRYRRVRLAWGDHVLSEADNWYVPGRLTAEMNRLLDATDIPFGRAVAALNPYRRTLGVEVHWPRLQAGGEPGPAHALPAGASLEAPVTLFEHRAVLYGADHRPLSEVAEAYLRGLLDLACLGPAPRQGLVE